MVFYLNGGVNKVWYRARAFKSGVTVQVKLIAPDFKKYPLIDLAEWESEGVYWFIFDFRRPGTWLGIIYEDDKKVTSNTFHVDISPGIVTHIN